MATVSNAPIHDPKAKKCTILSGKLTEINFFFLWSAPSIRHTHMCSVLENARFSRNFDALYNIILITLLAMDIKNVSSLNLY